MNKEVESVIDIMYESWLEYSGKQDKKCQHPSRETYGELIKHAQLWNLAVKKLDEAGEDERKQG